MHILLLASAFNSLTQRAHAELRDRGHTVAVELALAGGPLPEAVRRHAPELVVAPMLKTAIPQEVWTAYTCLVVHPGPVGDRGPSSLDWAIHEGVDRWGVTVLQADREMDAGDVWACVPCRVPPVSKSELYRGEIADAALEALMLAVERFAGGTYVPLRQPASGTTDARPGTRPYLDQSVRRIDWAADSTEDVLRRLRAADSQPGVLDTLLGGEWYLHGGHPENVLRGRPGDLLATRAGAVCRATRDGAVWIPELRPRREPGQPPTFRLPAVRALGDRLPPLPEHPLPPLPDADLGTWTDIRYREDGNVGCLSFSFPGGAMSTEQCRRLLDAYREACTRPTSVLVLGGERDFFSNGIHLNVIEAAADPAAESWANINAIDDLVEAVLTTTDRLVVAAVAGNAAAGGVMLALAADELWCRSGAVLNPHYRLMGLYGSEYWTYTLPRRVGPATADRLMREALPVSSASALRLGLADRVVDCGPDAFAREAGALAARLAALPATAARITAKKTALDRLEAATPLAGFRERELALMRRTFDDPDASYHALRRSFVHKERPARTPPHLASAAVAQPVPVPTAAAVTGTAHDGVPSRPIG
ncbi:putative two-component system hydrogenase maturation factor HypX/HoxX [Streptomyces achromogenes]|uniref:Two-component system hydrogenase maturation factor HypX/HoxX n=1 Tax=Streptomyces achromogenes TaxID=67255 RepID=A0ABU0QCQ7_STRAH|nr:hydrogenase maturation protein [Streptomyces achromogenes]MDQ0687956.1 putative two-component system hydrogenase maturation factor HypX/HoxX [Streptomyces achromogenes]MDQ0835151.1 putative two-component system hydrogenase maturation factor HypX/HoxX [Streptomyces achromogenes]